MDIITLARQLGVSMQNSDIYLNFKVSEQNIQSDENLQEAIGQFDEKKIEISNEIMKKKLDQKKLDKLNIEVSDLYVKINENKHMKNYNKAKLELQITLQKINLILMKAAEGEDPLTISVDEVPSGCGGNCGGCGGC